MKATFTKAVCYQAEATCLTPLRTAGADAETESVLLDSHGHAMVQGSSIAGALRGWLHSREPDLVLPLFGSQEAGGALIVSDGVFSEDADRSMRPRLRIDGASGAADDGGKFDVMHVNAGSVFNFTLTCLGCDDVNANAARIERMLAAMDRGEIVLGAQKTNGFGRVSLQVERRMFDMTDAADREVWLDDRWDGTPLTLPKEDGGDEVLFTLSGTIDGILVKSGQIRIEDGKSVTPNLKEGGRSILPGSSVKGAVRARARLIADAMGLEGDIVSRVFGDMPRDGEALAGRVRFEDATLEENKLRVSRIRINKFTGGVMRGGLFTEEPLSGEVTLRVRVPMSCPEGCALVLYALRDLGLGLYNLGSGGSIGRGFFQGAALSAETPDGRKLSLSFHKDGTVVADDPAALAAEWRNAWEVTA